MPLYLRTTLLIPSSSARVLLTTPKKPPITRMKSDTEIAPSVLSSPTIPITGAMKMSQSPCGLDLTAL